MRPDREWLIALRDTIKAVVAADNASPQFLYVPLVNSLVELSGLVFELSCGDPPTGELAPIVARAERALEAHRTWRARALAAGHRAA